MCLLAYFTPGTQPVRAHLEASCLNNPDGFGWAIVTDSSVILRGHSMDAETAIDDFMAVRKSFPENAALFHARWATHGVVDETNCHPFRVNGRDDTVMGHNGVLSCQPLAGDPRSDSRILADGLLMAQYRHLDSRKTRRRLESWLSGSKLVILTTDPFYRQQAYILNEDLGEWVNGIWYSNDSYLPRQWAMPRGVTASWWDEWPTAIGGKRDRSDDYPDDYKFVCHSCFSAPEECDCPGKFMGIYLYAGDGRKPLPEDYGDPKTWVCVACGSRGEVSPETGQCSCCLFMWCCNSDPWECDCDSGSIPDKDGIHVPMALTARPAVVETD